MSRFIARRCPRAARRVARQLTSPARLTSWPSMTFSATERFSQRLTSWYTVLIPAAWACDGAAKRSSSPSTVMVPESIE